MLSRSSTASIRRSISSRGTARFSRPKASSSRTVGLEADSWFAGVENTMPTLPSPSAAPEAGASMPATCSVPSTLARTTRGMKAAHASARVDLPAPVAPATPSSSPGRTVKVTSRSAGVVRPTYRMPSALASIPPWAASSPARVASISSVTAGTGS